jgi:transposase InsO family protein
MAPCRWGRLERFATKTDARVRVAAWIDDYNRARRHSALGMRSPIDYEHALAAEASQQPGWAA